MDSSDKDADVVEEESPVAEDLPETAETTHHVERFGQIKFEHVPSVHANIKHRQFYIKPRPRQWWKRAENGELILVREEAEHKVSWTELFYDLIFVAALANLGHALMHHPTPFEIGRFCLAFAVIWGCWADTSSYMNRFDTNDMLHKLFFLVQMVAVYGVSMNALEIDDSQSLLEFCLSLLLAKAAISFMMIHVSIVVPKSQPVVLPHLIAYLLPLLVFFLALVPDSGWTRRAVLIVAVLTDVGLRISGLLAMIYIRKHYSHKFTLFPVAIEHVTERYGLFTIIVLGEVVKAALHQFLGEHTWHEYVGTLCVLLISFALEWVYFDVEAGVQEKHALRRGGWWAVIWLHCHLPFHCALVISASGTGGIIEYLYNEEEADEHTMRSNVWLACAGFGVALIMLSVIGMMHHSLHFTRLRWELRVLLRLGIGVICILLPVMSDHMDPLYYLVILVFLISAVGFMDLYGTRPSTRHRWWNKHRKHSAAAAAAAALRSPPSSQRPSVDDRHPERLALSAAAAARGAGPSIGNEHRRREAGTGGGIDFDVRRDDRADYDDRGPKPDLTVFRFEGEKFLAPTPSSSSPETSPRASSVQTRSLLGHTGRRLSRRCSDSDLTTSFATVYCMHEHIKLACRHLYDRLPPDDHEKKGARRKRGPRPAPESGPAPAAAGPAVADDLVLRHGVPTAELTASDDRPASDSSGFTVGHGSQTTDTETELRRGGRETVHTESPLVPAANIAEVAEVADIVAAAALPDEPTSPPAGASAAPSTVPETDGGSAHDEKPEPSLLPTKVAVELAFG